AVWAAPGGSGPGRRAAAAPRRFVRETLRAWAVAPAAGRHGLVDDAVLLTSELVTNAVVHAGTAVQVTCRLVDGAIEVVVSDGHPGRLGPETPGPAPGGTDCTRGRVPGPGGGRPGSPRRGASPTGAPARRSGSASRSTGRAAGRPAAPTATATARAS